MTQGTRKSDCPRYGHAVVHRRLEIDLGYISRDEVRGEVTAAAINQGSQVLASCLWRLCVSNIDKVNLGSTERNGLDFRDSGENGR